VYLLRLALRPWRRAPWNQFLSALASGILLLLAAFMAWLQVGLEPVLIRLNSEQVITAYLEASVEKAEESRIADSIRTSLGAEAIRQFEVVDSERFIRNLKSKHPVLADDLEGFGSEMSLIIPRYVSVTGYFSDSALDAIRTIKGVESAESSRDRYRPILGAFGALKGVSVLFIGGLILALLTGLLQLARMNSQMHEDVISFLRLWGSGRGAARAPGLLAGMSIGFVGGWVAFSGWILGSRWLASHIRALSPLFSDMALPRLEWAALLWIAGILLGLLSGLFVARTAERRSIQIGSGGNAWV